MSDFEKKVLDRLDAIEAMITYLRYDGDGQAYATAMLEGQRRGDEYLRYQISNPREPVPLSRGQSPTTAQS